MNAKSGLFLALLSLGLLASPSFAVARGDDSEASKEDGEDSSEEGSDASEDEAAATKADETPELMSGAGHGEEGYFLSDGLNTMIIEGRVQLRTEYTNVDEGGDSRGHRHAFLIPRSRLTLHGTAYTKRLSYKFQSAFDKGDVSLKDFYLDYRVGEGDVRVRLGQFKIPFGRQFIHSSSVLEFVDRTIVNDYIGNGRDIGFEIHNDLEKYPETEWAVGVFNGTGDQGVFRADVVIDPVTMEGEVVGGSVSNVPEKIRPAVLLRVGRNSEGMQGKHYSEADLEGGGFRYSIGAAALTHFRYGAGAASSRAGVDFAVKQDGLSATGGVYADMQGPKVADLSYAGVGAYAQAGYMLNKTKQVAVLYASITEEGGDNQQEASVAFSHFEFGHDLKWQTDVTYLHTDVGVKRQDIRLRSQVQLAF